MPDDSPDSPNRFTSAIAQIDAANSQDPNRAVFAGKGYPAELLYGHRMIEWLDRLEPNASESLRLAVRCQHLMRWKIPRSDYPMTRPGYHQWRTTLGRFHAERAGEILNAVGYDDPAIARVQSLIRKERLKSDPETQTLEDVACLVFLEGDYIDFARKHEPEKVIDIVRKTWRKMSDRAHQTALKLAATLPDTERRLIEQAISLDSPGSTPS